MFNLLKNASLHGERPCCERKSELKYSTHFTLLGTGFYSVVVIVLHRLEPSFLSSSTALDVVDLFFEIVLRVFARREEQHTSFLQPSREKVKSLGSCGPKSRIRCAC